MLCAALALIHPPSNSHPEYEGRTGTLLAYRRDLPSDHPAPEHLRTTLQMPEVGDPIALPLLPYEAVGRLEEVDSKRPGWWSVSENENEG